MGVGRAIAAPGQSLSATIGFQINRGLMNSSLEAAVMQRGADSALPIHSELNTQEIFQLAHDQGVPLILLTPNDSKAIIRRSGRRATRA